MRYNPRRSEQYCFVGDEFHLVLSKAILWYGMGVLIAAGYAFLSYEMTHDKYGRETGQKTFELLTGTLRQMRGR